jgi:hypothetical protein
MDAIQTFIRTLGSVLISCYTDNLQKLSRIKNMNKGEKTYTHLKTMIWKSCLVWSQKFSVILKERNGY